MRCFVRAIKDSKTAVHTGGVPILEFGVGRVLKVTYSSPKQKQGSGVRRQGIPIGTKLINV